MADSTLPTMVLRMRGPQVEEENITIRLLTSFLWKYFDATNFHGCSGGHFPEDIMPRCDRAYIHYSLCAWDIQQYHKEWGDEEYRYWFRNSPDEALDSDECFAQSDDEFVEVIDYASAWDMTEADTLDWHTTDVTAVSGDWDTSQSTGWTDSVSGMFEGTIEYDSNADQYTGDISLAVPDTRDEYIDTDTYHMLSLGIVSMNPNLTDVNSGAIKVRWKEDGGGWSDWCGLLEGSGFNLGNGRDQWRVLGPIDLNDVDNLGWEEGDLAEELELSIRGGLPTPPPINPQPLAVRIGWVRLEESAQ